MNDLTKNRANPFDKAYFIKPDTDFDKTNKTYAPLFRKTFETYDNIESAEVLVCGLGIGYFYINGRAVSEDLFTAPVSDYNKTLWFNRYDVTDLIKSGKNVISAICGNGWYNEAIENVWHCETASWRDVPKLILALYVNGKAAVVSDTSWKYSLTSPVTFNQLRSGETFDARLFDEKWNTAEYNDSGWKNVREDDTPPTGVFRECLCEPIRECSVYDAVDMINIGDDKYVFDFGQNISGYIRMTVEQESGDVITIRYAEALNDDYSRELNDMETFYPGSEFMTDRFISDGKKITWSPKFAYHGFRYVITDGLKNPKKENIGAVFVHQDIKIRSDFECSDDRLNKYFTAGQISTLSNLFYMPTDCPTREKFGWTNDAQASAEQMLTNFETEKLFEKWLTDIYDAQRGDGALPGVVPTSGFGYETYTGPVCDGVLFEIPYRLYVHTGDTKYLKNSYPYFIKYLEFLKGKADENGDVYYGLDDWAAPTEDKVHSAFINAVLTVKFLRITILAAGILKLECSDLESRLNRLVADIKHKYIMSDGRCNIDKQTAVAMLIYHNIFDEISPLAEQLKELVEKEDFHHDCGMVGLRHLYIALNKCGLEEYAYKIITADGKPSYSQWFDCGATTLWELWNRDASRNHHMYSDFMSWIIKTVLGINTDFSDIYKPVAHISPRLFKNIDWAKGGVKTRFGEIRVSIVKTSVLSEIEITVPDGIAVYFCGEKLKSGKNKRIIKFI